MITFQNEVISQAVFLSGNSLSDYVNINTLFGAVIALTVLFLIMLITYFVKIKPNLLKDSSSVNTVDHVIAQIVENEEEELIGDNELVAVITAAIYASMGDAVPADGFTVRSIRKVNKRWKNA